MSHRVKNVFTLVNGIVGMSARYAKGQTLARDIQERLAALARAHDLTRPSLLKLESKQAPTTVRTLIDAVFAPNTELRLVIVLFPHVPAVAYLIANDGR